MGKGGGCLSSCVSFLFLLGLTVLFTWLAIRPKGPTISITALHMPALNRTSGGGMRNATSRNNTISMDIKLFNTNKDSGIYYDGLNVSLLINGSNLVGQTPLPGFYQGRKKTAHKQAVFNGTGDGWEAVFREQYNASQVVFRVVLKTWVRYKVVFFNTGHHSGEYVGNVPVGMDGERVGKNGVRLE
ncbi:unnamed protein product [Victoria cruziana]